MSIKTKLLLLNYIRLARLQGIKRKFFILSLDCDTEQDISVVDQVDERLGRFGIKPVYAVPGELLEKGKDVYKKIYDTGREFINHGYFSHSTYNSETGTYRSDFFYDKLTPERVLEDIQKGHDAFKALFGKHPEGFRTPHFGTFQGAKQLDFLHSNLKRLGYKFSTSTMPKYGFLRGPLSEVKGRLYEIPVSGCFDWPLSVLDSWGFRFDSKRKVCPEDYCLQFNKMLNFFKNNGQPVILNFYVDPFQVYDWDAFFSCMETASEFAVDSYGRLLRELGKYS